MSREDLYGILRALAREHEHSGRWCIGQVFRVAAHLVVLEDGDDVESFAQLTLDDA